MIDFERYQIVVAISRRELEDSVNHEMAAYGWKPLGQAVYVLHDENNHSFWYQTLVQVEEETASKAERRN
jgi:hypothetical protein